MSHVLFMQAAASSSSRVGTGSAFRAQHSCHLPRFLPRPLVISRIEDARYANQRLWKLSVRRRSVTTGRDRVVNVGFALGVFRAYCLADSRCELCVAGMDFLPVYGRGRANSEARKSLYRLRHEASWWVGTDGMEDPQASVVGVCQDR